MKTLRVWGTNIGGVSSCGFKDNGQIIDTFPENSRSILWWDDIDHLLDDSTIILRRTFKRVKEVVDKINMTTIVHLWKIPDWIESRIDLKKGYLRSSVNQSCPTWDRFSPGSSNLFRSFWDDSPNSTDVGKLQFATVHSDSLMKNYSLLIRQIATLTSLYHISTLDLPLLTSKDNMQKDLQECWSTGS